MANAISCHDTAQALVEELRRRLPQLEPAIRRRALAPLVESMLVLGDQCGIVALVEEFPLDFLHSRRALDLAVVCVSDRADAGGCACAAMAKERLHAAFLAARWERGQLSRDEVLGLLARHPYRVAVDPVLDLLEFSVAKGADAELALRAFTRFLAAYGLPPIQIARGPGPFLGRLSASRPCKGERDGPLVSVVVAARNARDTIDYAMSSLLAQSYRNLEILACDDASTDGTFDVLRERYGSDRRVRLFRSPKRQGTYNIRNSLVPLAQGSLVTFHDADDWSVPDRIAIQVRTLRPRSIVACVSSWVRLRADGTVVFFRNGGAVRMSVVSLMMSKERFLSRGLFRSARFGADFEFLQMLRACYGEARIARVKAPLIFALWSGTSLTRTAGCEALETGYRSPARRAYCEIVSRRTLLGSQEISDDDVTALLRKHDNYLEPSGVVEHT